MATNTLKAPKRMPSSTHEVIVMLEETHLVLGEVDTAPHSHELISYFSITKADEVRERIQCASIVIAPQAFITAESLGEAPYLKCVITPTAGTNHIDIEECRRRGIHVAKCAGSTSPAVAEHALSLYFAARRKTVLLQNELRTVGEDGKNSWKRHNSIAFKMQTANGHAPCSLEQEVAGIIGFGNIGKRLDVFCKALGMEVLVAERKKGIQPSEPSHRDYTRSRVPFEEVIESATVLFICCTFKEESRNMIDTPELSAMKPEAVIINLSRGGIMNNPAVIRALREKRISGVAVDVYDREPACTEEDSAFLADDTKDLNLTLSPHVGYFSTKTVLTMKSMVKEHIKNLVLGNYDNFES
ncbi:D-isomer specific 2-hydroxyacid dehydrogenase [Hypoxylon trugodes]|uniref:D-isomer specific 2-hydroxyacid dehydrogenase n=1 Tax=Hypoxylon trugodes TaxID=326681 RepID=UPI002196846C|nr:D-isomer specific 2-hydroxyacid dehydrogenase [Hypoxylon trugodes]KAI1393506.1 D-isomer specific 2-hydroxyacid dehydrogenase [Hypoxylon trugodes]